MQTPIFPNALMNTILLFDSNADGHHSDYLLFLIHYWTQQYQQPNARLVVVSEANFLEKYTNEYQSTPKQWGDQVLFEAIPQEIIRRIHTAKSIKRSFLEWNLVQQYQKKYQPNHTVLMYFDILQLAMLVALKNAVPISGIYFRPFPETPKGGWREWLTYCRKKIIIDGLLKQQKLHTLFCLDNTFVQRYKVNSPTSTTQIEWLPDPVERYEISENEIMILRQKLQIDSQRKIALIFGNLDNRKGIEQTLDAVSLLPVTFQEKICLLLVGKVEPTFEDILNTKLANHQSKVQVITELKGIYGRDIQQYFELADYSLALYQKHVGSSSIVIRAMLSRKPLLASDYGYVGNFVSSNYIGLTVDSSSPVQIAQQFERLLTQNLTFSTEKMDSIVEKNLAVHFATILFDGIMKKK